MVSAQNKPSCVVLGGGGFLGINLCRHLAAKGFRVRAFGRNCAFPQALQGIEWQSGNFSDPIQLATAIESFDIVFHLIHSAPPQAAELEISRDIQSNVIPSIFLLDLCRKLRVKRVIFASSAGTIYGAANHIPTPESAPTDPISAYGISKLSIEKYLALYGHHHSLDYRILRITNPFGPFQTASKNQGLIGALISRAMKGQTVDIWGDGTAVRDFVYIDDVSDAFERAALTKTQQKIFNIGSGKGKSVNDVIAAINGHLGKKLDVTRHEKRIIDVPVSVADIELAKTVLDWMPSVAFEDGLERTIRWWQNAG